MSGPPLAEGRAWHIQNASPNHGFRPTARTITAYTTTTLVTLGPIRKLATSGDYNLHSVSRDLHARPAKDFGIPESDGTPVKVKDDPDLVRQTGFGRRAGWSMRDPEPDGFFPLALIERSRGCEETALGTEGVLPGRVTSLRENC